MGTFIKKYTGNLYDGLIQFPQDIMPDLKEAITEAYKITWDELRIQSRKRELVSARQMYWYFTKMIYPEKSLNQIGEEVGIYDHTTVLRGIRQIKNLKESHDKLTTRMMAIVSDKISLV